jgi:uncharacterized membrane protein
MGVPLAASRRCAGDDRRVPNGEPEFESRAADRLIFFSDAVVAIAITLLAIDLPVPTGNTTSEFWFSVRHNDGRYAAFLISFLVIAAAWRHHHSVFRYLQVIDSRLLTLNLAWLLMIILNPFATKLLTTRGHETMGVHALRWGFYALLQLLASAVVLAMVHHMISHHLQAPGTPPLNLAESDWQSYGLMLGFGLSIPVFFFINYAWLLWGVVPLLVGRVHRLWRRNHHGPQAT